ncbi:MAG: hypothetical protein JXQ73_04725 [Phycisphaerae bacterium]|nr:hypothetical protein [Phycisphaerae bacterium]
MSEVDKRIERLIVRRMDGELTPAEQDELNQVLLRSAAARRTLSDYQENDRLATEVIGAVAEGCWPSKAEPIPASRSFHLRSRGALAGGLAVAAAVLIAVIIPQRTDPVLPLPGPRPAPNSVFEVQPVVDSDHLVQTGADVPHRGQRRVNRDYVGVLDDSGKSLLLFEVDRTHTVRIPMTGEL